MSKFADYWNTVEGSMASDTVRYFAKPLLREAFNAGRKCEPVKKPKGDAS